ncbi:MAG: DUF3987 domain-containing protein, partial [Myxococcota bacterium]
SKLSLFRSFLKGQHSQAFFNDEAGIFVGGYAMSKEQRMRTFSSLNSLWDGAALDRAPADSYETIRGCRCTMHLQIQPQASIALFGDPLCTDMGFAARCLIAEPESTMGQRMIQDVAQEHYDTLDVFAAKIHALLRKQAVVGANGLELPMLRLSLESRKLWISFFNRIESQLSQMSQIQGWAAKAAEHALRIAGIFTLSQDSQLSQVSQAAMQSAIQVVEFYMHERLRSVVDRPSPMDQDSERLRLWLRDVWVESVVSIPDVCRNGPGKLRKKEVALGCIENLVRYGHLRPLEGKHEVRGKMRRQCFEVVKG